MQGENQVQAVNRAYVQSDHVGDQRPDNFVLVIWISLEFEILDAFGVIGFVTRWHFDLADYFFRSLYYRGIVGWHLEHYSVGRLMMN